MTIGSEEIIYIGKEITPEQSSLLGRHNFDRYPFAQELSTGKGSDNNLTKQEYAEKINSSAESVEAEEGNLRFRIVDDPEEVAWFEDIA